MSKFINFVTNSDKILFNLINGIRSTILDIIMPVFTLYGSIWFAVSISILLLYFQLELGIKISAALITSTLIVQIIKNLTNRHRPFIENPDCQTLGHLFKDYSFPSGHTCAACTISIVLSYGFPGLTKLWIFLAIFTGISRVYQGHHYPTDVLAGTIIGCLAGLLSLSLL
ncbi:MAG: phosphatase PAP2 family protein [Clostridiales bacterium]|nr:phosphatase PAP2 family protein [Clostridiales bacterium]MCF8022760.1 phosphatase PAP2 family protein [Clostridiales bacterium]